VFELYHLIEENEAKPSSRDGGPLLPAVGHAVAGAVASALAKSLVYPLEIVITRMQVQRQFKAKNEAPSAAANANAEYKSLPDAARKIYRAEGGIRPFYTGLSSDVTKGIIDSFLFFLAYQTIRTFLKARQSARNLPVLQELAVGVVSGCISKSITSPIQNIVTRQQTAALIAARDPESKGPSSSSRNAPSVREIAQQIKSEKGIAGFWAGYSAAIILTLNPAITFAAENFLKRLLPRNRRKSPPPAVTFLLAALSKVIATTLTYPVMLAKARAQTAGKDDSGNQRRNPILTVFEGQIKIFRSLHRIYTQEGIRGLYSGIEGEVMKGFIQHGLTMMAKDRVHDGVIVLYYTVLRLTKQFPSQAHHLQENLVESVENVGSAAVHGVSELVKTVAKSNES
jgi:hypothetical protein